MQEVQLGQLRFLPDQGGADQRAGSSGRRPDRQLPTTQGGIQALLLRHRGQSNSVGTEVGVEVETNLVFAKAKASVTAKYEHEWTEKHEFGQEVEIDVEPGDMAWVAATSPIYRDTGDFTLTLGKTTWKLTDVYFDTADPKRTAMFLPDERALTPAEYKQMCTRPAEHQGPTARPSRLGLTSPRRLERP